MISPDARKNKIDVYQASNEVRMQGERAVQILQAICQKWQTLFSRTWIKIIDRYGVEFYETPNQLAPAVHYSLPLDFYEEPFGTLYSAEPLSLTPSIRNLTVDLGGTNPSGKMGRNRRRTSRREIVSPIS